MTLNTKFIIDHPGVDPFAIFKWCNALIGAVDPKWDHREPNPDGYPDNHEYANAPGQGFDAWLILSYGDPLVMVDYDEETDEEKGLVPHDPPGRVMVAFDTAYGFSDERGRGCGGLHADYIRELGQLCESNGWPYHWLNEFTGEWHDDWRQAVELIHGSDQASAWFERVVKPAVEAEHGEVDWT